MREYKENDFIVIPARWVREMCGAGQAGRLGRLTGWWLAGWLAGCRTPHMFEFLEDNFLLEWWDEEFKAWWAASEAAEDGFSCPNFPALTLSSFSIATH